MNSIETNLLSSIDAIICNRVLNLNGAKIGIYHKQKYGKCQNFISASLSYCLRATPFVKNEFLSADS